MKKLLFVRILLIIILVIASVAAPIAYGLIDKSEGEDDEDSVMLNVWQIDGFEGGKGSRKKHIESIAAKIFENQRTYVTVISISSEAARENINAGTVPDVISYPAGFYGIENIVKSDKTPYTVWCEGRYMLLTLDENSDFDDVESANTVINSGVVNAVDVTALFLGLENAVRVEPTVAYLKLLNGKYKYLLGTQRDIFRLETRNVSYKVKVVTEFNDLYQCASCLTSDANKVDKVNRLIEALENSDVSALGLFSAKNEKVNEKLAGLKCECGSMLKGFCSESYALSIKEAAKNLDLIKLKSII